MNNFKILALLIVVIMTIGVIVGCEKDKQHEFSDLVPSNSQSSDVDVAEGNNEIVIDANEGLDPDKLTDGEVKLPSNTLLQSSTTTDTNDKKDDEKDNKKEDDKKEDSSSSSTSSSSSSSSDNTSDTTSDGTSSAGKWSTGWIIPQ